MTMQASYVALLALLTLPVYTRRIKKRVAVESADRNSSPSSSTISKLEKLVAKKNDVRIQGAFLALGGEAPFNLALAKAREPGADSDFVKTLYCKARTGFYQWHVLNEADRKFIVKEWVVEEDVKYVVRGMRPRNKDSVHCTPLNWWPKHELGQEQYPRLIASSCPPDEWGDPGCELPEADPDCDGQRSPGEMFRLRFFRNVLVGEALVGPWHMRRVYPPCGIKTRFGFDNMTLKDAFDEQIVLTEPIERKERQICCCPGFGVGMKPQGTSHWPELFQGDFTRRDFLKEDRAFLRSKKGNHWCHMKKIPAGQTKLTCPISGRIFDNNINWEPVLVGPATRPHLVADDESCNAINALFFQSPSDPDLQGHSKDLKGLAMISFRSESYHRYKTELHSRVGVLTANRRPLEVVFRPMEVGPNANGAVTWIHESTLLVTNSTD